MVGNFKFYIFVAFFLSADVVHGEDGDDAEDGEAGFEEEGGKHDAADFTEDFADEVIHDSEEHDDGDEEGDGGDGDEAVKKEPRSFLHGVNVAALAILAIVRAAG